MSYEGYDQNICANGHSWTVDCYASFDGVDFTQPKCPVCKADMIWWNSVDTTNGSFETNPETGKQERIDGYIELEVDKPAVMCQCSCGNVHEKEPATYKIPDGEGHMVR